ncbi:DUF4835 domain-containing protein [Flavobacterium branchiophilum NBRC 15030 = ATCC 35035]|uniref:DUF4835 domain-containing protein n=1 Tax=Flavobacterium branchiophilum TaxID=55197 RepID=A0A2H3KT08_9FLAO|nr:DUF4835 family protein [Flavobacterium branchiophilum]OXA74191.1 DUF4835 domain-containing protein [Flavobacterium branchiophilum NBRC 15030 = ATCC 35035]PDS22763.1 DUF4835 domain-containing protein [Flavobacterium branchiophilum]TQM42385.1 uncharacterized protein DUF4835 [Flavobacterium branchiophilum]GEM54653.1 DUF4835 domain-containing protein [Flavobacterium branchiophilum NBRC 15030 = ATCC 35035]
MNKIFSILLVFSSSIFYAQELKCNVIVNSEKLGVTNQKVFKTLETSLNELINKTNWTSDKYEASEKINCTFTIILESVTSDLYAASLQVQSSRPVFDTSYAAPILNINDKNFNFKYYEFENLTYNPTSFDSNLVAVVAFYCYMIIGLDQDTFVENGGNKSFEAALNILNLAQGSNYKGWSNDKTQNRFALINDILSPTFGAYRNAMYQYHRNGLDVMSKNAVTGKEKISLAINELLSLHQTRPNSYLARTFFDAKSDEIVSIFSGGPKMDIQKLLQNINTISPLNASKWATIKN